MKTFAGLIAVASAALAVSSAHAQTRQDPPLDYARTVSEPGIVVVPYIEQARGVVFYTEYEQVATSTGTTGPELRRLYVNLRPTAHSGGAYNTFIRAHGIADARVQPFVAAEACRPADNILNLLSGLPERFRPSILPGNYPVPCTLSVYFLPEDETRVRDLIASEHVIVLSASIPLCAPDSPRLNTPAIVDAMKDAQSEIDVELDFPFDGSVSGNVFDVPAVVYQAAKDQPALFEKPDVRTGRSAFLTQFVKQDDILTLAANRATVETYVCVEDPLELSF